MKMFRMMGLLCLTALALIAAPAYAQEASEAATKIGIPWGNWLGAVVDFLATVAVPIVLAFLARLFAVLPGPVVQLLRTMQVEQLLQRAVDFGLNAVKGAAKDKTLSVDTGSEVVAMALNYVIDKAPAKLIQFMGGELAIREMILARLKIEEAADLTVAVATPR